MLGSEAFRESTSELVTRWAVAFKTLHGRALGLLYTHLQVRAVATPVRDLSRLLDKQGGALKALRHLQMVERALRNGDRLDLVPAPVLQAAFEELALLSHTARSPGLGVLLLQMRRQVASNVVRGHLARAGQAVEWRPSFASRHRTPSLSGLDGPRDSEFETTVPVDRASIDSANDSTFTPLPPNQSRKVS